MQSRFLSSAFALLFAIAMTGCGGNVASSNTPAPKNTSPTPAPAPTGGGGTGSGGSFNSAAAQYTAAIQDAASHSSGQVAVDTSGQGLLTMQTSASSTVQVNWCNFPDGNGCLPVGNFTSDASGKVSSGFSFPGHGNFAGVFNFTVGGTARFSAAWSIPNGNTAFAAVLLAAGSVSAGLGQSGSQIGVGSDRLSGGSVTVQPNSSNAHVALQGAVANSNYPVTFCANGGSSSCYALGVLVTDSSGNGSFDTDLSKDAITPGAGLSGVFFLHRQTDPQHAPYEYVSGLKVP